MDVNQLRTLVHVAELGSVSRAADRLSIAQPALSRQIRLLEQELGTALFARHGRGMVITEMGREVLAHAVKVLAQMDAIRDTVAAGRTSFRGSLTIGTTPTIAEIVTVPLVERLRDLHPNLALRLSSAYSGHLIEWLQRGQVDVAVSYNPDRGNALRVVPIMLESLLLIAKTPNPKTPNPGASIPGTAGAGEAVAEVPFRRLADRPLVLPSPGHMLRDIVDACARRAGIRLRTVIEADSFQTLLKLVDAGIGATVLPLAPVHALIGPAGLSATRLVDPVPTRRLVVAFAADRPVSPAARFVGDTIVAIALDLAARGIWVGQVLDPVEEPGPER